MNLNKLYTTVILLGAVALVSCGAGGNDPGTEYSPNMYHSVAYDPLKQIKDPDAGRWVNSSEDDIGEYYSSNPNNPHEMNMLEPVENSVRRGKYLPYRIPKDSLAFAAANLVNPLDSTAEVLAEGKRLYTVFCSHCHGDQGVEAGKVGEKYAGVPSYKSPALINITEGHIFHVITMGKGRMGAHGSQLNQEERWMVAKYVKVLQAK